MTEHDAESPINSVWYGEDSVLHVDADLEQQTIQQQLMATAAALIIRPELSVLTIDFDGNNIGEQSIVCLLKLRQKALEADKPMNIFINERTRKRMSQYGILDLFILRERTKP